MGKRRGKDLPPYPPLSEIMTGRFGGLIGGPYDRWVDGKELGPYTPRYVPIQKLKLMREDPQISLGLAAYRGPFFGIDYDVEGGSPAVRAFIRKVYLDTPLFTRTLETILLALDYGFSPHELIYDFRDVTFDPDGPGGAAPITMLAAAVIVEANDIDPMRVRVAIDEQGHLLGYQIDGHPLETIPIEKALHAVHCMEHRNWRGRPRIKPAYNPWYWSAWISLFKVRWFERKADPPYHAEAPADPRPDPKNPGQVIYPTEYMRSLLLELRGSGVIVTPFELDQATKQKKWTIRELTDGGRAETFLSALAYLDALKLRAITVPEELATRGSVGSQAKTETVLGLFYQALELVKDTLVLRTINTGIIEPLIRWNFGAAEPLCYITAPEFNREKDLMGQLAVALLNIPQQLADGRVFRLSDLIDAERLLSQLSVPYHKAIQVARKQAAPATSAGDPNQPEQVATSPATELAPAT